MNTQFKQEGGEKGEGIGKHILGIGHRAEEGEGVEESRMVLQYVSSTNNSNYQTRAL